MKLTLLHSERPKLYTILAFLECSRVKGTFLFSIHKKSLLTYSVFTSTTRVTCTLGCEHMLFGSYVFNAKIICNFVKVTSQKL